MTDCLKMVITGRVQGVYFRANTQKQAIKLNLNGYVRNLPDGAVEVVAQGEANAVQQLLSWCHRGPLLAKVESVSVQTQAPHHRYAAFEIL